MTVKIYKTAEELEIDKLTSNRRVELDQVNKYLAKITESQKRARRTQVEINQLKKKTKAVLAKLP